MRDSGDAKKQRRFVSASYDLAVPEDGFLLVRVRQRGLDVAIELFDAANTSIRQVDGPSGGFGREELPIVLPEGRYRVEVSSKNPPTAQARVEVAEPTVRPATERDRRWAQAADHILSGRRAVKDDDLDAAATRLDAGLDIAKQQKLAYWVAYAHEQLAVVFRRQQTYDHALSHYEAAVTTFSGLKDEARREAFSRQYAALFLLKAGRVDESIQHLEQAWPIFEHQGYDRGVVVALLRLAPAYLTKGRFQIALDHLARAREVLSGFGDQGLEAHLQLEKGKVLLAVSRTRDALQAYTAATDIYRSIGPKRSLGIAYSGLANAALQLDELEKAEAAIEASLSLESDASTNRAGRFLTRGHIRRKQLRHKEAKQDFNHALKLAEAANSEQALAHVLLSLGYLEALADNTDTALEHFDRAQGLYDEMGDLSGSASARARAAEALRSAGRLTEAWDRIEPVTGWVEQLRASASKREHRLSFFGSFRQDYFTIARDIRLELGREDQKRDRKSEHARAAFMLDEQRRARELLDSMRYRAGAGRAAERQESALDVSALQRQLPENALLLVYSVGESSSLLWTVSRRQLRHYPLPAADDLESRAIAFRAEMLKFDRGSRQRTDSLAHELSTMLLGNIERTEGIDHWLIVADGELQAMPFAALPLPGGDGLVIDSYELSYFPSATVLSELRKQNRVRVPTPRLLAFADPVFEPGDERVADTTPRQPATSDGPLDDSMTTARGTRGLDLDRLPHSAEEGRFILSLSPRGRLVTGFEANRQGFETVDWSRFDILHLATHALYRPHGELSAVVLSLVDAAGVPRDGLLSVEDISRLSIPLDMVVLSACDTGLGSPIRGEGMLSLAWSFLDAGAARVVSSLWSVDDRATTELMKHFYRGLIVEGLTPSAALRQAQLKMKGDTGGSLYTWAGFTLQGDWS